MLFISQPASAGMTADASPELQRRKDSHDTHAGSIMMIIVVCTTVVAILSFYVSH